VSGLVHTSDLHVSYMLALIVTALILGPPIMLMIVGEALPTDRFTSIGHTRLFQDINCGKGYASYLQAG
jgi:hypothetical protein